MAREPEVHTITTAAVGTSTDQRSRQRVYLLGMAVRTACFLGAIVVDGVLRWVMAGAAVLLPYVAVVAANAGRDRSGATDATYIQRHAIGNGS